MNELTGYLCELFVSYQGEGPWIGKRQLFIRLAGCSRGCDYCDTKSSWLESPKKWRLFGDRHKLNLMANPVSVSEVILAVSEIIKKQGIIESIALTGGEPLQQKAFLVALIEKLKKNFKKTKILLETNGLEDISDKLLIKMIDFFSIDFKIKSTSRRPPNLKLAIQNLKNLKQKKGCVKIVVNQNTTFREISHFISALHRIHPGWELIIQPQSGTQKEMKMVNDHCNVIIKKLLPFHSPIRFLPQMHRYFKIK